MSSLNSSAQIRRIGDMYMLYVGTFNLVFGILGNIFNILIFTTLRVFKGNQSAFYLTVESISNIMLLLILYVSILTNVLDYDPLSDSLALCKIRVTITYLFGLYSLFSICFLSFDQYLSTNLDYFWRRMSTLKLAHYLSLGGFCFCALHSLIFLFSKNESSLGCAVYNPIAKVYLAYVYYPIISGILPLISTTTTSLFAYRNVRRIVRRQIPIVRRRLDRQMTALTLTRVIVCVVCGVPFLCISVVELNLDTTNDDAMEVAIVYLISRMFYMLVSSNFVVHFYVFLIVSSRFRRQAKVVLIKRCWPYLKCQSCRIQTNHLQANQISPERAPTSSSSLELE